MSKPREFWVENGSFIYGCTDKKENLCGWAANGEGPWHVIEKSYADALAAELERVKAQNEIMKVALHGLNNEVVAMLVTHGDVIAQDYGRTNLECVEYRLKIAREALAKVSQVNLNTHPESEEVW